MDQTTLLVKKTTTGKIQYQKITLSDAFVSREWGLVGGKPQETSEGYGFTNAGKANQLTPNETAKADYDRIIKNKIKEGCHVVENLDSLPDFSEVQEIDLDNIPSSLCLSKPKQKTTKTALNRLIKSGNGRFFIKYNGLCHYILIDSKGEVKIYTRKWFDHTRKYLDIVKDVLELDLPNSTLLGVELVVDPLLLLPHMTAFSLMNSIHKSDTLKGELKEDLTKTFELKKKHPVKAAIFCIPYCDGQETWSEPYNIVLNSLRLRFPEIGQKKSIFVPSEVPIKKGEDAFELVRKNMHKIEGLVAWDLTQSMEMTVDGKPKRVACWKVKAVHEMDVIAYGYDEGTGRNTGKIGSLKIGRYNEEGELIDMGTAGGLKAKERNPDDWTFPCVVEVTYSQVFPDTGALQFGSFSKIHEDKTVDEVDLFSLPIL